MKRNARTVLSFLIITLLGLAVSHEANAAGSLCPSYGEEVVHVSLSAPTQKAIAGGALPLTVRLTNAEDRLLSGGALLVRLVSSKPSSKDLASAEGAVFLRLVAAEDVSLRPHATEERQFSLILPQNLPAGSYRIEAIYALGGGWNAEEPDTVLESGTRANGNEIPLAVENPSPKTAAFVDPRSSVTEGTTSVAAFTVVNPSGSAVTVPLVVKTYYWGTLSDKTLVGSVVKSVDVAAKSKKTVSVNVSDSEHSRYELVAEAQSEGVSSFAVASLDRDVSESIVRSAGFSHPADGPAVAYACVHTVFTDDIANRSVFLVVKGDQGEIGRGTFAPSSSENDFSVVKNFTADGSKKVSLEAGVLANGSMTASVLQTSVDCAAFGGCSGAQAGQGNDLTPAIFALTMLAAGTGGLITMRYYLRHVRRNAAKETYMTR